jgi:hypothetical protein
MKSPTTADWAAIFLAVLAFGTIVAVLVQNFLGTG